MKFACLVLTCLLLCSQALCDKVETVNENANTIDNVETDAKNGILKNDIGKKDATQGETGKNRIENEILKEEKNKGNVKGAIGTIKVIHESDVGAIDNSKNGDVSASDNGNSDVGSSDTDKKSNDIQNEVTAVPYEVSTDSGSCGGNISGTSGYIESRNYPGNNPGYTNCIWVISVDPGYVVKFILRDLYFYYCCCYDFLEVRDGSDSYDPVIEKFCDTEYNDVYFNTTGNEAYVLFNTDNYAYGRFQLYWEAELDTDVECGGTVYGSSGLIESPGFPAGYPSYSDCEWTINVDYGSVIKLQVLDFNVGSCCCYDSLEVRDGWSNSYPQLGKFCSGSSTYTMYTTDPAAYVRFLSDASGSGRGFQIYWEESREDSTEPPTTTIAPTTTTQPSPSSADAFSVSLNLDTAIDNSPLVFDRILYNQQGLYNQISGIFEPQVHGLYFLTTSLLSTAGTNFHVYIARNQELLCKSMAADSATFVGTCGTVAELFPGDQVRVTGNINNVGVATGDGFSSFSGYLITRLN